MTPFAISAGVIVKDPPLHIVAVRGLTAGLGLTVTITVKSGPVHVPNVGVTVYVAVCAELVGLVSVPVIFAGLPLLAAPPVTPPVTIGAPHE